MNRLLFDASNCSRHNSIIYDHSKIQNISGVLPTCNVRFTALKPSAVDLPDPMDSSLGAELKRKRLALGWSQESVAKYFKVLKDSYQR